MFYCFVASDCKIYHLWDTANHKHSIHTKIQQFRSLMQGLRGCFCYKLVTNFDMISNLKRC